MIESAVILTIGQIIFLEGILSVDNAAVLGALAKPLPRHAPVPWPAALHRFARRLDRILGGQRDAALKVGLIGAYLGRAIMLILATTVMEQPWLRVLGGLFLLSLLINYLGTLEQDDDETARTVRRDTGNRFWSVVVMIELVDLAFSLDNVVAVVALSSNLWVVMAGVALGILLMRFAAGIFNRLIEWEPNLELAAYLLIGAISIELLADELFHLHFVSQRVAGLTIGAELQQFGVSAAIVAVTVLWSRTRWLQPLLVIWRPVLHVCMWLRVAFTWVAWPFRALVQLARYMSTKQSEL